MSNESDKLLANDAEFKAFTKQLENDPNVDWSRVRFWNATHRRERFLNFLRGLFGLKEKR